MKNLQSFEEFLNESLITESVKFTKPALIAKLKQKLVIADKAVEKWGDNYQKQRDHVEAALKSGKITQEVFNIQGDTPKDRYALFQGGNSYELANELAKIIKKYKKYETETSSVGAAAGWSGTARSTVSGFIRGVTNHHSAGGMYGSGRNYPIAIQIGGGIDSSIRKKIIDEVLPLFYMLDEFNGTDGGVSLEIKTGTNYDTIGLTCSKYQFSDSTAKSLSEIMNQI